MTARMDSDAKLKLDGLDAESLFVPMKNVTESPLAAKVNAGKKKDFVIPMKIVFQVSNVKMTESGVYSLEKIAVQKISGLGNVINSLNGCRKPIGLEDSIFAKINGILKIFGMAKRSILSQSVTTKSYQL